MYFVPTHFIARIACVTLALALPAQAQEPQGQGQGQDRIEIDTNLICDTQQQVDEYWDKFVAAGGKPVACGWITDHFGVSWQINPKLLIDLITSSDPVKAGKAMQAMMTMVKIDSEQLKRALAK